MFKVLAITAKSEREILARDTLREACAESMKLNNKSNGILYIVEYPGGTRLTINEQKFYLEAKDDCKHLRQGGNRIHGGFKRECLSCGFVWFEADKPLTEEQEIDKARFEHSQQLKEYRET